MYPEIIDNTNFRFLKVDDNYIVTFIIYGFPSNIEMFKLKNLFPKNEDFTISMHYIKQNSIDMLRKISSSIALNEADRKDIKSSNFDIDVVDKIKDDAKKLRYDVQINNQEVYKSYIVVKISSRDKDDILLKAQRFKTSLITKMINVNTLNFRHLYGFVSNLPFGFSNKKIFSNYYMNLTTNNVLSLFPFYTNTIFEKNGILIGRLKDSSEMCMLDMFNENHLNSNVCIFGSSGSGKSYFTKLLILRNYLKEIKQYVIDPEGEYNNLPGIVFDIKKDKVNLLEIFEEDITYNFLDKKIEKILNLMKSVCNFTDELKILEEAIKEEYNIRNITNDMNTIYFSDDTMLSKKKIPSSKFPTISDVITNIDLNKEIKKKEKQKILKELNEKFNGEYEFLNGITNKDLNSDIVIFNISNLHLSERSDLSKVILELIEEKIKNNYRSLIYIDEVWKLIYKNEVLSNMIFDLYKTVRKRNAGIVTITQDVSDFFSKDTGGYGKSIFNNSYIKIFFKVEYQESKLLQSIGIVDNKEYLDMIKLNKGEMNMYINSEAIKIKIESSNYEKEIIEGSEMIDNSRIR